ncbi:DUF309 domain-containing protein [Halalkalicoccus subterraneus]|uniref:DUF309 domain-containing protein n=1 Tax=Halalkalicoccus subterraneus TaxID=2675002 RepID=UPI000EFA423D|nr:DUF309 domain-containing protein [Halalkalicoccus subterraneus]
MDRPLRIGIALYNDGWYHAAHDAWEPPWLELSSGTEKRFLQGLIQYTAAIHHARGRNWAGATGLAGSAYGYLDGLSGTYRGVDLIPVREGLSALAGDPEWIERTAPPRLVRRGRTLSLSDLDARDCLLAAPVLAAADDYDAETVERACSYAHEAIETGDSNLFLGLCTDFVREPAHRELVYGRLAEHVSRRRSRERDVEGLFDPSS